MVGRVLEPRAVTLSLGARRCRAIALALDGQRASLRLPFAPDTGSDVRVVVHWSHGVDTDLAARVRKVGPHGAGGHVADVDVRGIEGDWRPFLAWLGPLSAATT
jgi:hypothetical protein